MDIEVYSHTAKIGDTANNRLMGSFLSEVSNEVHICTQIEDKQIDVDSAITFRKLEDSEVSKIDDDYNNFFEEILMVPTLTVTGSGEKHTLFTLLSAYTKSFGIELKDKSQ